MQLKTLFKHYIHNLKTQQDVLCSMAMSMCMPPKEDGPRSK
jgi:hypothetical protein